MPNALFYFVFDSITHARTMRPVVAERHAFFIVHLLVFLLSTRKNKPCTQLVKTSFVRLKDFELRRTLALVFSLMVYFSPIVHSPCFFGTCIVLTFSRVRIVLCFEHGACSSGRAWVRLVSLSLSLCLFVSLSLCLSVPLSLFSVSSSLSCWHCSHGF